MIDPDAQAFLDKARHDLEAARILLDRETLADIVCFHAQQTAEKALKGALVAIATEPPRTHDLTRLLDELVKMDGAWEALRPRAEALADFAVAPRYPEWELAAPAADAAKAVRDAAAVLDFVVLFLDPH